MKYILLLSILLSTSLYSQKGLTAILEGHSFVTPEGKEQSLAEMLRTHTGKIIYVDFWASWCGPCRKELPASKRLHKALEGEDIVFFYLSIDDSEVAWKRAVAREKISEVGEHWRRSRKESRELLKFFYIYSIPHYMIVGRDGQIVNRDALPPSDPRTKRQLRKWLAKE